MGWEESRFKERREEFKSALGRLRESHSLLKSHGQPLLHDALRDSLIQRFEFCYELAWKTAKLWLESKLLNPGNPKDVFREALKQELISDGNTWSELQENRNLTSHTYDQALAEQVSLFIQQQALGLFEALLEKLSTKQAG